MKIIKKILLIIVVILLTLCVGLLTYKLLDNRAKEKNTVIQPIETAVSSDKILKYIKPLILYKIDLNKDMTEEELFNFATYTEICFNGPTINDDDSYHLSYKSLTNITKLYFNKTFEFKQYSVFNIDTENNEFISPINYDICDYKTTNRRDISIASVNTEKNLIIVNGNLYAYDINNIVTTSTFIITLKGYSEIEGIESIIYN